MSRKSKQSYYFLIIERRSDNLRYISGLTYPLSEVKRRVDNPICPATKHLWRRTYAKAPLSHPKWSRTRSATLALIEWQAYVRQGFQILEQNHHYGLMEIPFKNLK